MKTHIVSLELLLQTDISGLALKLENMENFCQSQPDEVFVLCTAVQLTMSLPQLATTASAAEIVDSGLHRELT